MLLSWNEIKHRAIRFASEWQAATSEKAERQTFWNEFFDVFGVSRRRVAAYEEPVRNLAGNYGFIDLIWPGTLIVEHKSAGQDLGKAASQAFAYIRALADAGREKEIPRYVIVSDFVRVCLYDLEPDDPRDGQPALPLFDDGRPYSLVEIPLAELHNHIRHFAFISGYKQHKLDPEDPANEEATALMCDLHDALHAGGYEGHELRRFLVRILFCLFAEDTGIFPPNSFELYIKNHTRPDGSDLGSALANLFEVLNTPDGANGKENKRQKNLDEDLSQFPFVNGELFSERIGFAAFNSDMRNRLLACIAFRWERISPAIFGALFQSVMDAPARRQIGAHYTAEKNILKLIRSLFLDELREEFASLKKLKIGKRQRLEKFHTKLAALTFFDPACGCGNFLIITYREMRRLELELLQELHSTGQRELTLDEANALSKLNVHQFYGIEIEEFPVRIAEVGLWLADHQANIELSHAFSQLVLRLPLRVSPHIHVANALTKDWREILPPEKCSYILGNPPFVGGKFMDAKQRADMESIWGDTRNFGLLDYVTCWHRKAAEYTCGGGGDTAVTSPIRTAFVSTNSITHGEQVGILWKTLFSLGVEIIFAHRTFAWESESKGKAHVHCVIIGFASAAAAVSVSAKRIYDYERNPNEPSIAVAANINPYLTDGPNIVITNRASPLCDVPEIGIGNKPIDGGNYLFTPEEKEEFLRKEPDAAPWFRRWIGSEEYINGIERWVLWLGKTPAAELRRLPECKKRVDAVYKFRLASKSAPTRKLAGTPARFHVENFPTKPYLAVPKVSSEKRKYIPIGFVRSTVVSGDALLLVPDATLYHFGILTSQMHMAWMRFVCGRLKSDYRYSAGIVYNNYAWPNPTAKQRAAIESAAQRILDLRVEYGDGRLGFLPTKAVGVPRATLADLYDPLVMPADLLKAHQKLDRLVERAYRPDPFESDRARVEHLFHLYQTLTAPLLPAAAKPRQTRRKV